MVYINHLYRILVFFAVARLQPSEDRFCTTALYSLEIASYLAMTTIFDILLICRSLSSIKLYILFPIIIQYLVIRIKVGDQVVNLSQRANIHPLYGV
jgi:hypothetical protein